MNNFSRSLIICMVIMLLPIAVRAQNEPVPVDEPLAAPPPMEEIIVPAPGEGHVWIPGHWDRKKDEWVWHKGAWVHQPRASAYWLPSHWEERGGQWRWKNGGWAFAPQGYVVTRVIEKPARPEEVRPPQPPDMHYWVPGYWEWTAGTWQWMPGRWTNKPDERAEWMAGTWKHQHDGAWQWHTAHWVMPTDSLHAPQH